MRNLFLTLSLLFAVAIASAQTARVQVIHNSPTPGTSSGPTVDIYVNDQLLPQLTAVPFRAATPFLDVPAGTGADLTIDVRVSPSTLDDMPVASFPIGSLTVGETYVVTANGIVGDMDNGFDLDINVGAQESAAIAGNVEFAALHGSPGAPNVDVEARTVAPLFTDLAYGNYSDGYASVPPALYYLDVKAAGDPNIVATFEADLSGLADGAATVFASGILGGSPAFGLFAALPNGTVVEFPATEVARAQIIHNSPSPTVDVYANGGLIVGDFEFRTATEFIWVPAGVELDIQVVPAGGDPATQDVYNEPNVTLDNGSTYVLTAGGILGSMATPFTIFVNPVAREASGDMDLVSFAALHGSPDAPAVDVDARAVATLITDLAYGSYTDDYISVPPATYFLDVRVAGDPNIVATFEADLNGLGGGAATVFASGLLAGDPDFGLFAALPDGTVVEFPAASVARLQLIHNSPDPTVDVYANGGLLQEDFEFRTATEFFFVPADVEIDIQVVPAGGDPATDDLYLEPNIVLDNGNTYVAVAAGIAGDMAFPFTIQLEGEGQESAMGGTGFVDINLLHSSPGAPAVDVIAAGVVSGTLADGFEYGDFTGYIEVIPAPYLIGVTADPDIELTYFVDLEPLAGGAATVFASGIVGGSPAFGLFAALPNGDIVELQFLDEADAAGANILHNSPGAGVEEVDVYFNGFLLLDDLEFQTATGFVGIPSGIPLDIGVAPSNSTSVADTIYNFNLESGLAAQEGYIITAGGIVGDPTTPFGFQVYAGAKLSADDATTTEFQVLHSSPDAPAVDVDARAVGTLVEDLAFGEYTDYTAVPSGLYYLDVRLAGDPNIVATFAAPLDLFEGDAVTVFASGLLAGDPDFGIFVLEADGNVTPLEAAEITRLQIIHNSPEPTVDIYANDGLLYGGVAFRTATEFDFVAANTPINIKVVPEGGALADAVYNEDITFGANGDTWVVMANGIAGDTDNPFTLTPFTDARESAEAGGVDLLLFHGSPDAPEVDVVEAGGGTVLFDNISFGSFSNDYVNVPAGIYDLNITPSEDNGTVVRSYIADVTTLEGGAATVFASGFLTEGETPAFEVWVALPDGNTFPLQDVTATEDLGGLLNEFAVTPNVADGVNQIPTWSVNLSTALNAEMLLFDINGRLLDQQDLGKVQNAQETLNISLESGQYFLTLATEKGMVTRSFMIAK
ncbi:MAG: DUF4397 domain-containing protein [Bacteroidota bacterium]